MAGFLSGTGFGAYTASKFAVMGISEALATDLEPSALAGLPPALAKAASIGEYGAPPPKGLNGMAPSDVAELVLKGIKDNELYIFTHPEMRPWLEKRVDRCLVAYRKLGPAPKEIMG
jgi:short-subunit dehydrogenase